MKDERRISFVMWQREQEILEDSERRQEEREKKRIEKTMVTLTDNVDALKIIRVARIDCLADSRPSGCDRAWLMLDIAWNILFHASEYLKGRFTTEKEFVKFGVGKHFTEEFFANHPL